jgi:hypothetical protein
LLDEAYPMRPYGTVLPFRRIFVVAHRAPPRRAPRRTVPSGQ